MEDEPESEKQPEEQKQDEPKRPVREKKEPERYGTPVVYFLFIDIPKNYKEAVKSENSSKWIDAMELDMANIEKNGTWKLMDTPVDK